jgi:ribosomal protein L5
MERKENLKKKIYVAMTDKFMSRWGMAKDKTNKLVVETDSWEQAETIAKNAKKRSEMAYVNITGRKPHYNKRRFLTSTKKWSDLGGIWKE